MHFHVARSINKVKFSIIIVITGVSIIIIIITTNTIRNRNIIIGIMTCARQ
jgi:hypothetical protein